MLRRALALTLCSLAAAQERPAPRKLDLELLLEFESVGDPRLSPDGSQIVYTRTWSDKIQDRVRNELWIMRADGSRQRFLANGSDARWSPDGERIAFLADGVPAGTQIHVVYPATREVTQITRVTELPREPRWSPDGESIAFSMQVPEKDGFPIEMPKAPKDAKWAPTPTVITRLSYRRDRSGYAPSGFRHLFVVDATGGTPRQVTSGDFDHAGAEWTPDGQELVFDGKRFADADWQVRQRDLYAVDVATGTVRNVTEFDGSESSPVVSPNGKWVAFLRSPNNRDTYNVGVLCAVSIDGTGHRELTADFDREPQQVHWLDDRALCFTADSDGRTHAYQVTLDGARTQLTDGMAQLRLGDVGRDGTLCGVWTTPHDPGDICTIRPGAKTPTRLTRVHADVLHGVALGAVEEIRYESVDGLPIQGWVVKPPDFDPAQRYPLILQIHGGPHAMYGVGFDFERQNHAAEGYVVLYVNPRGSTGYGKAFGNAIQNAYPDRDYDDLMRGVDEVIARGFVDERNLFVYGGSGGGVLTCWIVGHTDRFRAAVSMYPVTNWISFVGTTDGPSWYHNFAEYPWQRIDEHWRRSPLRHVGNVSTPTMLLTGELDLRTPMGQTEEFYQALKLRKVDTVMVRVPDEYHGASGRHPSNRLRRILYVRGWFEKHRAADGTTAARPDDASAARGK
jgi:dipeptidyl aminopeptidase/acylaminoacyl peptidase